MRTDFNSLSKEELVLRCSLLEACMYNRIKTELPTANLPYGGWPDPHLIERNHANGYIGAARFALNLIRGLPICTDEDGREPVYETAHAE